VYRYQTRQQRHDHSEQKVECERHREACVELRQVDVVHFQLTHTTTMDSRVACIEEKDRRASFALVLDELKQVDEFLHPLHVAQKEEHAEHFLTPHPKAAVWKALVVWACQVGTPIVLYSVHNGSKICAWKGCWALWVSVPFVVEHTGMVLMIDRATQAELCLEQLQRNETHQALVAPMQRPEA